MRKERAHATIRVAVRGSERVGVNRYRKNCVFCAEFTCNRLPPYSRLSNFYKIRPIFKASNFYKIRA